MKKVKECVLKVVVRFDLRVFKNIMVLNNWVEDLEETKIDVAFEKLDKQPLEAIQMLKESISRRLGTFTKSLHVHPHRLEQI